MALVHERKCRRAAQYKDLGGSLRIPSLPPHRHTSARLLHSIRSITVLQAPPGLFKGILSAGSNRDSLLRSCRHPPRPDNATPQVCHRLLAPRRTRVYFDKRPGGIGIGLSGRRGPRSRPLQWPQRSGPLRWLCTRLHQQWDKQMAGRAFCGGSHGGPPIPGSTSGHPVSSHDQRDSAGQLLLGSGTSCVGLPCCKGLMADMAVDSAHLPQDGHPLFPL